MAIDIQSQAVSAATAASQKATVSKASTVKESENKETPKALESKDLINEVSTDNTQQLNKTPKEAVKTLELPRESLEEAVNKLQDYVDKYDRDLKFSIDDDTGRTVVRLLDRDQNIVKQYPSEDVLSLISNLEQNKGLFIGEA